MDIGAGKSGASSELILDQGLTAATTGDRIVSKVSEDIFCLRPVFNSRMGGICDIAEAGQRSQSSFGRRPCVKRLGFAYAFLFG
jgi:hypothetical protein